MHRTEGVFETDLGSSLPTVASRLDDTPLQFREREVPRERAIERERDRETERQRERDIER